MPIEYLAGIVDGEGTVNRYKMCNGAGRCYMTSFIIVTNTYLPMLEAIKKAYGGRVVKLYKKLPSHYKPQYRWELVGKKAEALAVDLLPHLIIKAEDMRRILNPDGKPAERVRR